MIVQCINVYVYTWQKSTRNAVPVVVQELPVADLMAGWTRCMNVLVSCDYQDGSAAGAGKKPGNVFWRHCRIIQATCRC